MATSLHSLQPCPNRCAEKAGIAFEIYAPPRPALWRWLAGVCRFVLVGV